MPSYYGLCTWLDHNIGRILEALEVTGLDRDTTIIHTSDHGDNVGARRDCRADMSGQGRKCVVQIA